MSVPRSPYAPIRTAPTSANASSDMMETEFSKLYICNINNIQNCLEQRLQHRLL